MIKIICLGKLKENYLIDLTNDYLKRIKKYHKIELIELKEERTLKEEKEKIKAIIKPNSYIITLAIEGIEINSLEFSKLLEKSFNSYREVVFIIGSSEGLDESLKEESNLKLSFSKFTLPHGLFRGLLLEQIYRAFKILNNESYHK